MNWKRITVYLYRVSMQQREASGQHNVQQPNEWTEDRDRWMVRIPPNQTAHRTRSLYLQFKLFSLRNLSEVKMDAWDNTLSTHFFFFFIFLFIVL